MFIPIRLKNTSQDTLYGPFTVEITRLDGVAWSTERAERQTTPAELLNSSNGLTGKGARIDYTSALRDLPAFPPGAVSEAITWRVKVSNLRKAIIVDFDAVITG